MTGVAASVPVLLWAAQRAGLDEGYLTAHFPKWPQWLSGDARPTLKQLEEFATLTHTAFGDFFLPQPPELTFGGSTSFSDAFRMLGVRKTATFHTAARKLGVAT